MSLYLGAPFRSWATTNSEYGKWTARLKTDQARITSPNNVYCEPCAEKEEEEKRGDKKHENNGVQDDATLSEKKERQPVLLVDRDVQTQNGTSQNGGSVWCEFCHPTRRKSTTPPSARMPGRIPSSTMRTNVTKNPKIPAILSTLQLCGRCPKCKYHLPKDDGPTIKNFQEEIKKI